MDIETSEQLAFIPEQVESILMTVVDGILRTEVYVEEKRLGLPRKVADFRQRVAGSIRGSAGNVFEDDSFPGAPRGVSSFLKVFLHHTTPFDVVGSQVSHWVNAICDRSMQELHDLSKPFKYVVSCVIVQKNGAGFHIGHSAYWDISNDNICQVTFCLPIGGMVRHYGL